MDAFQSAQSIVVEPESKALKTEGPVHVKTDRQMLVDTPKSDAPGEGYITGVPVIVEPKQASDIMLIYQIRSKSLQDVCRRFQLAAVFIQPTALLLFLINGKLMALTVLVFSFIYFMYLRQLTMGSQQVNITAFEKAGMFLKLLIFMAVLQPFVFYQFLATYEGPRDFEGVVLIPIGYLIAVGITVFMLREDVTVLSSLIKTYALQPGPN